MTTQYQGGGTIDDDTDLQLLPVVCSSETKISDGSTKNVTFAHQTSHGESDCSDPDMSESFLVNERDPLAQDPKIIEAMRAILEEYESDKMMRDNIEEQFIKLSGSMEFSRVIIFIGKGELLSDRAEAVRRKLDHLVRRKLKPPTELEDALVDAFVYMIKDMKFRTLLIDKRMKEMVEDDNDSNDQVGIHNFDSARFKELVGKYIQEAKRYYLKGFSKDHAQNAEFYASRDATDPNVLDQLRELAKTPIFPDDELAEAIREIHNHQHHIQVNPRIQVNSRIENTKQISFESNGISPWGFGLDFESWQVDKVEIGKQGYLHGVQPGWIITKVNGLDCEQNKDVSTKVLIWGSACTMTFQTQNKMKEKEADDNDSNDQLGINKEERALKELAESVNLDWSCAGPKLKKFKGAKFLRAKSGFTTRCRPKETVLKGELLLIYKVSPDQMLAVDSSRFSCVQWLTSSELSHCEVSDSGPLLSLSPRLSQADTIDTQSLTPISVHLSDEIQECPICEEELAIGEDIVVLENCQHKYHTCCVARWFEIKPLCPLCNTRAKEAEELGYDEQKLKAQEIESRSWPGWSSSWMEKGFWLMQNPKYIAGIICSILIFCSAILSLATIIPVFARHTDLLDSQRDVNRMCSYSPQPFLLLFLSCICNAIFVLIGLFPDKILHFFQMSIGKNTNEDSMECNKVSFGFGLFALVLHMLIFARQLVKDIDVVHNLRGNSWERYQCYGFIGINSPNMRGILFAYVGSLIRITIEGSEGKHWLNERLEDFIHKWNYRLFGCYALCAIVPMILTHYIQGFLWYIIPIMMIKFLVGKLKEKLGICKNFGELRENTADSASGSSMLARFLFGILSTLSISFFLFVLLVGMSLIYEVMTRYYGGYSWHTSFKKSFQRGTVSDYVESLKTEDILLVLRAFF